MCRFVLVFILFLMSGLSGFAANFDNISVNSKVYYNHETNKWSTTRGGTTIEFVKHLTLGNNVYSEYAADGLYYDANSTQEFFHNGDLIGYNKNSLKFHRIYFSDDKIQLERLNEKELKEIFPEVEIIRVSDFKDNYIKVKRSPFRQKTYLLMNDTNLMFYNYSFENLDNSAEKFVSLFTPRKSGKYYFVPAEKSVTYQPYVIHLKFVL